MIVGETPLQGQPAGDLHADPDISFGFGIDQEAPSDTDCILACVRYRDVSPFSTSC